MKRITVPEEGIETLFGSYDENLKHLESLFNVRIRTQGHDLLVEGESSGSGQSRPRRRSAVFADARRLQAVERRCEDCLRPGRAGRKRRSARPFSEGQPDGGRKPPSRAEDGQPAEATSTLSNRTTSCSASARPARAKRIWRWRRRSRFSSRRRSAASSSRGRRSRRARSSGSCRATCRRR